jgi:hypothetical protein
MALAYERIRIALHDAVPPPAGPLARLRARIERDWESMRPSHLDRAAQRAWEDERFTELFEHAQRGRHPSGPVVPLSEALAPAPGVLGGRAAETLRELLRGRLDADASEDVVDDVSAAILDYLRVERAALRSVVALQGEINALLRRPAPSRPLSGADLAIHHALRVGTPGALPYLLHGLRDELGLEVDNTDRATRIFAGPVCVALD